MPALKKNSVAIGLSLVLSILTTPSMSIAATAYDFGKIPYDSAVSRLPNWAVESTCDINMTVHDCSFYDSRGVKYVVWDRAVVEKSITIDRYNGFLPYGLSPDDDIQTVKRKLENKLHARISQTDAYNRDSIEIYTENLDPEHYDSLIVYVMFSRDGHFQQVTLTSDYS